MTLELNMSPVLPADFYLGLCPELRAAAQLNGPDEVAIYHPFVHDPSGSMRLPYTPEELNKYLKERSAIAEKCRNQREWRRYIALHQRPYRCEALWNVRHEMTDREFWDAVGKVWTDSENVWQYRQQWHSIFASPRPEREYTMPEKDRAVFADLPDQLEIYRGCNRINKHGFSWTLDPEVAQMFARRNIVNLRTGERVKTRVIEQVINKSEAIAYLNDREEDEIVTLAFARRGRYKPTVPDLEGGMSVDTDHKSLGDVLSVSEEL